MMENLASSTANKRIREAAEKVGTTVIFAPVLARTVEVIPTVFLDDGDFVKAIFGLRPRAIYLAEDEFDALEEFQDRISADRGADEDEPDDESVRLPDTPAIHRLLKTWQKYDGAIYRFTARFMLDGVQHYWMQTESWYQRFDDEADELIEEVGASEESRLRQIDLDRQAGFRERAKVLAAHALFKAPKATKARRAYLARQLFPDSDDLAISMIVEEAESIFWYQDNTSENRS